MRRKHIRIHQFASMTIIGLMMLSMSAFSAQARSLEEIKRTKEIRVCVVPIHPSIITVEPEGCREDCQVGGPAYEEVMAFVAFLGDEITPYFLRVEWDEQFFNSEGKTVREASYTPELLASDTCDLYPSNLVKLEWRTRKLDFVTLFPSRMMVIVNATEKPQFSTPGDLAGKVAAVEKDTSFHTFLQGGFTETSLPDFRDISDCQNGISIPFQSQFWHIREVIFSYQGVFRKRFP